MFLLVQVSNDDRTIETMTKRKNAKIFVLRSFLGNDSGTTVFLVPPSFLAERGRSNEDGMKKVGGFSFGKEVTVSCDLVQAQMPPRSPSLT